VNLRGRVIAVDATDEVRLARVRTIGGDVTIAADPRWQPGDLVSLADNVHVESLQRGAYPSPSSEVFRLSQTRIKNLAARSELLHATRMFFRQREFMEVETPLRVPAPGLELHLDAVASDNAWLITSPEFQMKRLLVAGLPNMFQICRCFRGNESGPHHACEFTMIEWYRSWASLDDIAVDTETLVHDLAVAHRGMASVTVGGRTIDLTLPWPRLTVADALSRYAAIDFTGDETATELRAKAAVVGIDCGQAQQFDDVFFAIFLNAVEPALAAMHRPVLLTRWPAPLAALARRCSDDVRFAERFEAYVGGMELANAFGELTDAVEQRQRFATDLDARKRRQRAQYPLDQKFLSSLEEGMPPSAGIALGFDRLVMLLTGSDDIRDVLTFHTDEL
jgi:elongation factor P--(R)-beta-lysine ligase